MAESVQVVIALAISIVLADWQSREGRMQKDSTQAG
jgi:hypothetical protein